MVWKEKIISSNNKFRVTDMAAEVDIALQDVIDEGVRLDVWVNGESVFQILSPTEIEIRDYRKIGS